MAPSTSDQVTSEVTPLLRPDPAVTGSTIENGEGTVESASIPQASLVDDDDDAETDEDAPLPKLQLLFLLLARTVEPIAYFCIFPYINQMLFDTGEVKETDVGFYSGLIVCTLKYHTRLALFY
jgi:hypothetical protein